MNIPKSTHKLPDSLSPKAASAQETVHAKSHGHAHAESSSHAHGHAHAKPVPPQDSVQELCPGHGKPNIIDLFPDLEQPSVRTLAYPEAGESIEPPVSRTLAYPENGEAIEPPVSRTLAYPEGGEHPFKPGKPFPSPPCKCWPGKDEFPINKLPKPGQDEFPILRTMTSGLGEAGDSTPPMNFYDSVKPLIDPNMV
ncbi:MAG: hypothetical protein CVV27_11990 [Candidatus Melainabacteria bacterium HGW-Melainabacteria-1]|nr:MAG: hypothetical protein CVV27_11990 [Candidatus Melainabacteria bacterium HGW-Melainabacteria-1]